MPINEGEDPRNILEILGPELSQALLELNLIPEEFNEQAFRAAFNTFHHFKKFQIGGYSTEEGADFATFGSTVILMAGTRLGYKIKEQTIEDSSDA